MTEGNNMTIGDWLTTYSNIIKSSYSYRNPTKDNRTHREAIFIAAAKLMASGRPYDTVVGYLVDEGGYMFTQTIGTLGDVILREAEQFDEVSHGRYTDNDYVDHLVFVPEFMANWPNQPDMVDGNYYALITIQA